MSVIWIAVATFVYIAMNNFKHLEFFNVYILRLRTLVALHPILPKLGFIKIYMALRFFAYHLELSTQL